MTEKQEKIVQTAGRDRLGDFAPEFAHYNDDILFGENWNNQDLDLKTRCLLTVTALMAQGITDASLEHHLQNAKIMGLARQKSSRPSLMLPSMLAGPRLGLSSIWLRGFGLRNSKGSGKELYKLKKSSSSHPRTVD